MAATAKVESKAGELVIEWYRGDSVPVLLQFREKDGQPVDLSDGEWFASVRTKPNVEQHWPFVIDVSNAADGDLTLTTPSAPDVPPAGVWDLRRRRDGAVLTILAGRTETSDTVTALE